MTKSDMKDSTFNTMILIILITIFNIRDSVKKQSHHEETIERLTRIEESIKPLQEIKVKRSGTIATDFNNLGCIRNGNPKLDALAIGYCETANGKFLVFETPFGGAYALQLWKEDRGEWSVKRAISVYAPNTENNTSKYIKNVCKELNCKPSDKLKTVNSMAFIKVISKLEGWEG